MPTKRKAAPEQRVHDPEDFRLACKAIDDTIARAARILADKRAFFPADIALESDIADEETVFVSWDRLAEPSVKQPEGWGFVVHNPASDEYEPVEHSPLSRRYRIVFELPYVLGQVLEQRDRFYQRAWSSVADAGTFLDELEAKPC